MKEVRSCSPQRWQCSPPPIFGRSRVALFWAAFILTRPLGATVGDFLDKPREHGGLALSRPIASAVLAVLIVAYILILPQRAGRHPRRPRAEPRPHGGHHGIHTPRA